MEMKKLTDKQKEIMEKNGLFVVKACPGSGKTFTVAARLAEKLSKWSYTHRGIAALSFTNVAWQEIEKAISEDFGRKIPISFPHFLGTIDSFINQYIFLPFGHLVMKCSNRPELVGPPLNNWEPFENLYSQHIKRECHVINCKLNSFSYDVNGNIISYAQKNYFNKCRVPDKPCINFKKDFNSKGYSTQSDANFFAMKILGDFPSIAKSLSYRFPLLMVDEAQDTSEVQMKIIDLMIENGLKEVMLIGDSDQAIYEWRDADPTLFINKYEQWKNNSVILNENWRSSQMICDFFSKISIPSEPVVAKNEMIKDFGFSPEICGYQGEEFGNMKSKFLELCEGKGINLDKQNIAILARGNDTIRKIMGIKQPNNKLDPWNDDFTKEVAESKYLFDQGDLKQAFKKLEKAVCKKNNDLAICKSDDLTDTIAKFGFTTWRSQIYSLLKKLPQAQAKGLLKDWVEKANKVLKEDPLILPTELKIKRDSEQNKYSSITFDEIFALKSNTYFDANYKVGTVHSVKGETLEAVLLVLKQSTANRQCYANVLNDNIADNEELRIVYVAITRPSKILVLAVPEEDKNMWKKKFQG